MKKKKEYEIALDNFIKSLNIYLELNHPDIANTYNNIGLIYQKKVTIRLDYSNKSLNIWKEK